MPTAIQDEPNIRVLCPCAQGDDGKERTMMNNSRLRPNDAQPATVLEGLMQDWPLTLDRVVRRMESTAASASIADIAPAGIRRRTFADIACRIRRIGPALQAYGIKSGDRVATIGFNTPHHLELFLGVPAAGAVRLATGARFEVTVRTASLLVAVPKALETMTRNSAPLSLCWALVSV